MPQNIADVVEPATPECKPTTINLGEVVKNYLEALQKVYDVINYTLASERLLNEQEYEAFSRNSHVMPSQASHMDFDTAKEEMNHWLIKQTLNEILGVLVLFLDDIRTISAISKWKSEKFRSEEELQKILREDRATFLRLDLPAKIDFLKNQYKVVSQSEEHIKSLYRTRLALANRSGSVTEKEAVDGKLTLKLRSVTLKSNPGQQGGVLVTSEIGDLIREFEVGKKIKLAKNEHIAAILTVAFFITSQAQSLKEYAQGLGVTSSI